MWYLSLQSVTAADLAVRGCRCVARFGPHSFTSDTVSDVAGDQAAKWDGEAAVWPVRSHFAAGHSYRTVFSVSFLAPHIEPLFRRRAFVPHGHAPSGRFAPCSPIPTRRDLAWCGRGWKGRN